MSVCLMISNPINKNEDDYYVPICYSRYGGILRSVYL